MKPYTVLLLRPEHIAFGGSEPDTYLAHVTAASVTEAILAAQEEAYAADTEGEDEEDEDEFYDRSQDYARIAVFEGHLRDLGT